MSTKESIICDACSTELIKDTMYPHEFALELSVIDTNRPSSSQRYLDCIMKLAEDYLYLILR